MVSNKTGDKIAENGFYGNKSFIYSHFNRSAKRRKQLSNYLIQVSTEKDEEKTLQKDADLSFKHFDQAVANDATKELLVWMSNGSFVFSRQKIVSNKLP